MSRYLMMSCSVCLAFALGACGDDEAAPPVDAGLMDGGPIDAPMVMDGGPDDAGPPADAGTSGLLTIEANGVTGASGKIVLAFVTPSGGGTTLGGICAPVMSDPGDVSSVVKAPTAGDPCTLGADVVFPNGAYDVNAGIYTPGMMTPDLCASTTANVVGNTTVTLPAFAVCP